MIKRDIKMIEEQMEDTLKKIRLRFEHPGDKGTQAENTLKDFLRRYLPRKFDIGSGEVLDTENNRSGQTDVVIVNEDHPLTFETGEPGLFFIEGVATAGEVKMTLNKQNLNKALENSVKFKKLRIKNSGGDLRFCNPSDGNRYFKNPPFFIFAYESIISLDSVQKEVEEFIKQKRVGPLNIVDGIFLLDNKGWVINFGDGLGAFRYKDKKDNITGWKTKETESVLFDLVSFISICSPKRIMFDPVLARYLF